MLRLNLILFSIFLLTSQIVFAGMFVDRSVVTFKSGTSLRQDVIVTNPDAEPAFIEVEVLEVTNPGTPAETREVVKDPQTIGLIASPRRFMVPPGRQKVVRLVSLNGFQDSEQVYRVNVRPVQGDVDSNTMGVIVVVAYQLLVFIEPETIEEKLVVRRENSTLFLENQGNSNIQLSSGKQCTAQSTVDQIINTEEAIALENAESAESSDDADDCFEAPNIRLYPGNKTEIQLQQDAPVTYRVKVAGITREETFP